MDVLVVLRLATRGVGEPLDDDLHPVPEHLQQEGLVPPGEHWKALLVRQEDVHRHDDRPDRLREPPLHLALAGRQVRGELQRHLEPRAVVAQQAEIVPNAPPVDLRPTVVPHQRYSHHELRRADAAEDLPVERRRVQLASGRPRRGEHDAVNAQVRRPMQLLLQGVPAQLAPRVRRAGARIQPIRERAHDRGVPGLAVDG
mmetsp:Transcript_6535/g.19433  ORF Transcript_6535/g.19433 Transcript_6535/m.19433 type:complete len:200 (+) Transcript_6535:1084-1683(+)